MNLLSYLYCHQHQANTGINIVRIQSYCVYLTKPICPPVFFSGVALFQNLSLSPVCIVCSSHLGPLEADPGAARSQPQATCEKISRNGKGHCRVLQIGASRNKIMERLYAR